MLFLFRSHGGHNHRFASPGQYESARHQLVDATTPAGSAAFVVAPLFVVTSRFARAESKRRSGLNPAVRRDEDRDFDPQRAKGARAGLSKRGLPSSPSPASAGLRHPNKFIHHNDGEPSLLPPPRYEIIPPVTARKEAGGGLHAGGLGLGPGMGAGQRFPSAGIARLPPSKTGAGAFSRQQLAISTPSTLNGSSPTLWALCWAESLRHRAGAW